VKHLLVTNDFPPKVGGIQSYLWELWRRLPPGDVTVLTTPSPPGDVDFDRRQRFRVVRDRQRVLVPTPALARRIDALADEVGASVIVLDPVLPLGAVGPWLRRPFSVVVHGAEVTVPGRLPGSRSLLGQVLREACQVFASGEYVRVEAERAARRSLPVVVIPPGVDAERFKPLSLAERAEVRSSLGLGGDAEVVLGVGRLVPRKGFDVLVEAAARLAPGRPDLVVAVAGAGRQAGWLARLAASRRAPVRLLGRVPDETLPLLYAAADVFASPCRTRWGGLEQEGFGIVFLEAAAVEIPVVAGASGGAGEAVIDGETGMVVERPADPASVASALATLLDDPTLRRRMGEAARRRVVAEFGYDVLADRLSRGMSAAMREPTT
jgi:phosphatidylinositol alpha-1,6-mannosyltransferase